MQQLISISKTISYLVPNKLVRLKFYLVSFSVIFSLLLSAQEEKLKNENGSNDTIPFILTNHNNISVNAVLNNIDSLQLMFHTAANDISLIKESTANLKSIKWNETIDGAKSWGGTGEQRLSKNNLLSIGAFKWDSLMIWESLHSGPTTDGKFGPNLFDGKHIEINFDSSSIIIHDMLPSKINLFDKIPILYENGNMFIEAVSIIDKREVKNRYLIHSGYKGAVLYDDVFVAENKIADHIVITDEQELKDSFGNILKTKKGKLGKFMIGEQAFQNIPVGFFEGAIGRQKMSILGGNVLKRFNLIIDSKREYLYVKANSLHSLPFIDG